MAAKNVISPLHYCEFHGVLSRRARASVYKVDANTCSFRGILFRRMIRIFIYKREWQSSNLIKGERVLGAQVFGKFRRNSRNVKRSFRRCYYEFIPARFVLLSNSRNIERFVRREVRILGRFCSPCVNIVPYSY